MEVRSPSRKNAVAVVDLFTPAALTDAGTITPDVATQGQHWTLLATSGIGATRQIANPSNPPSAGSMPFTLRYKQDGTGGRALTFGSKFVLPANFQIATASNAITLLRGTYYADVDQWICDGYQSLGAVAIVPTEQTVASSSSATDVVSFTVPANTLGTTGQLYMDIPFEFVNNQATAATLRVQVTYGATLMFDDITTAQTGSLSPAHPGLLTLCLAAINSTTVQSLSGAINMGTAAATTVGRGDMAAIIANATGTSTPIRGTAAETSTADKVFKVTITMSVNNAATTFKRGAFVAYMLGNGSSGAKGDNATSDTGPVAQLTISSGVMNVDCALGPYYQLSSANFNANVTSITFTNLPAAGVAQTLMFEIHQNASAAKTMAWPASFKWGGSAPSISTGLSKVDLLALTTFDQGTTWLAVLNVDFH